MRAPRPRRRARARLMARPRARSSAPAHASRLRISLLKPAAPFGGSSPPNPQDAGHPHQVRAGRGDEHPDSTTAHNVLCHGSGGLGWAPVLGLGLISPDTPHSSHPQAGCCPHPQPQRERARVRRAARQGWGEQRAGREGTRAGGSGARCCRPRWRRTRCSRRAACAASPARAPHALLNQLPPSHPQILAVGAAFALSAVLTAAPAKADIVSCSARRMERACQIRPDLACGVRMC